MAFTSPDSYDRFMGRYSKLLAPQLADLAGVVAGQQALDVGCGVGALTGELVSRLGPEAVAAVDPSEPFVTTTRDRYPGVDVQVATADELPFPDHSFDATLAQLVVHFMKDPVAGLGEMRRVTRPGGVVAACVWDHGGSQGPLVRFWEAARRLDHELDDESHLPGVRQGHLGELFRSAGLDRVEETGLTVEREYSSFDDWWEPFTLGVGPAGSYFASLEPSRQTELEEATRKTLLADSVVVSAVAWAARGVA